MIRPWLVLLLSGCAASPPPAPPVPVVIEPPAPVQAAAVVTPKLRAALDRAVPREAALVAAPDADASSIALVRLLDSNVRQALRDLDHHATPATIQRAKTAVKDLQNHLDEYQAAKPAPDAPPGIGSQP